MSRASVPPISGPIYRRDITNQGDRDSWGTRPPVPFQRGRIGPWGRTRCSPVPLYAAPCKAGHVSRRYLLAFRRFANVGVAGSSPVSCSRKREPRRGVVRRGFLVAADACLFSKFVCGFRKREGPKSPMKSSRTNTENAQAHEILGRDTLPDEVGVPLVHEAEQIAQRDHADHALLPRDGDVAEASCRHSAQHVQQECVGVEHLWFRCHELLD